MNSELLQGFYLGDLLIEPLNGRVIGRSGSRHLPPNAVEVLLRLAHRPGELVEHDTLIYEIKGRDHGSQETLGRDICEIRHPLDDHPDNPVFIQTPPKRGYRLVTHPVLTDANTGSVVLRSG